MRKPLFAGNWKMHKGVSETREFFRKFLPLIEGLDFEEREIMIAPPFVSLYVAGEILKESAISLGAQNACWEKKGAFTGEISPVMLKELGVKYVILGHSERRHIFGEDDELVAKRMKGVYEEGLCPILCVGETLEERENGVTFEVVARQLKEGLKYIESPSAERIVIAYEPVWAIGTGKTATPSQAEEVHSFIRKSMSELYGEELAKEVRILYGGSVKPGNIKELISQPDIDGVLVGGASLDPESFSEICKVEIL
jgi:triosephosphate isomerase